MLGSERGQTIPFWAFALLIMLAMMLYVYNAGLQATWNVRAQNAADSAAAAGLSVQANIWNEESTILYATAVDEYRLRALNQAILNTIAANGGCTGGSGNTCDQNYQVLRAAYNNSLQSYLKDIQLLGQADQFTEGGQQQDARKAISGFGGNCGGNGSGKGLDCNFAYTMLSTTSNNGNKNEFNNPPSIEVIACRNVSYVGGGFLGTAGTFQAVAHASSSVVTASSQNFAPGTTYQPTEKNWYGGSTLPLATAPYEVAFGNPASLQVNVNWYGSVQTRPTQTAPKNGYTCQ